MAGAIAVVSTSEPSPDRVRVQLERILSSRDFGLPHLGRRFLQFIVEETLDGRGGYLKAFTIAQAVFGRDVYFDAQRDPCVRVQATRIRRELERYYLLAGPEDEVLITVPIGTYVPSFRIREVSDVQETAPAQKPQPTPRNAIYARNAVVTLPWQWLMTAATIGVFVLAELLVWLDARNPATTTTKPSILVEPFEAVPSTPAVAAISEGLSYELVTKLVSLPDIVVKIDSTSGKRDGLYLLQGTVLMAGQRLRSSARLVRRSDGAVVWAENYDDEIGKEPALDIQSDVAESIATSVARPLAVVGERQSRSPLY
ncbi:hypothetical protein [Rhizobium sp. BK456]|uniref:hypothetical protein n=1 Tax=Rhizobium sp. BK456 TaxID=2587007 RepID=UPI00160C060D|nr:hypothetical protein [Rhizobium sp. BK456]MBB3527130.1 TolB-like protein [Rhizobium sp. BK456]